MGIEKICSNKDQMQNYKEKKYCTAYHLPPMHKICWIKGRFFFFFFLFATSVKQNIFWIYYEYLEGR